MEIRRDLYLIGNGANPKEYFQTTPIEVLLKLKSFYDSTPKFKGALVWTGPVRIESNRLGNVNFMSFDKEGYFVVRPTNFGIFFHMQTQDSYSSFDFDRIRDSTHSLTLTEPSSDVVFSSTGINNELNSGFRISKNDSTKIFYYNPLKEKKETFFCDYVLKLMNLPFSCYENNNLNLKEETVSKKTFYATNLEGLDMRIKASEKNIMIKTIFKKNMHEKDLEKMLLGMSINHFNISKDRSKNSIVKESTVSFDTSNTYEMYQFLNALATFNKEN